MEILEGEGVAQVEGCFGVEDTVQVLCVPLEESFGGAFLTDTEAIVEALGLCDIFSPWVHVFWGGGHGIGSCKTTG